MAGTQIHKLGAAAIDSFSTTLARSSQGLSLSTLEQQCPKLAQALKAYQGNSGAYYRGIGNARMECALLRFARNTKVSGTIITETPISQPLYKPRYTAAVGVLMAEPAQIHTVNHTLNVKTPEPQTEKEIQARREAIVVALRKGILQSTVPRMIGYGTPRQEQVNESIIDYTPHEIAAFVVPESPWRDGDNVDYAVKHRHMTNDLSTGFEQARLTVQLAYVSAKLGDMPILTFDGSEFKNLELSSDDWTQLLTNSNALMRNHKTQKALADSALSLHSNATGLEAAMAETSALDAAFDMHELKHLGGICTSVPINIGRYLMRIDT